MCERNCIMEVLTQQCDKVEQLNGVVASNLSEIENESSIQRLKNGLKDSKNVQKDDIKINTRPLNQSEKRELFELTLKMGNLVYYNKDAVNNREFKHNYSLRFIELDEDSIAYIEAYKGKTIILV